MIKDLKSFYKKNARSHLPWRTTTDPYKILVSEIMLQQTQVDRVVPYYTKWIKKYPTAKKLAAATLSDVLKDWQGLGYNRRGKYLHDAAKILAKSGWTQDKLPGVGPYTRAAVEAFAFNKPTVFIETNIRTVFFHHYAARFNLAAVTDKELLLLVAEALKKSKMQPRDFYAALMDYGSHLKKSGVRLNKRSKHYTKQSKFEGSARQKRAAKLRQLLAKGAGEKQLLKLLAQK